MKRREFVQTGRSSVTTTAAAWWVPRHGIGGSGGSVPEEIAIWFAIAFGGLMLAIVAMVASIVVDAFGDPAVMVEAPSQRWFCRAAAIGLVVAVANLCVAFIVLLAEVSS